MMSGDSDFHLVSYKRNNNKTVNAQNSINQFHSCSDRDFDKDTAIRRINDAKEDIILSDFYKSVKASFDESLSLTEFDKSDISEIICLGLGRLTYCMCSRYQFALLCLLKEHLEVDIVKLYDPIFNGNDLSVIREFGFELLDKNFEGKHVANEPTVFFLPHCPKQLSNNLLWANWNPKSLGNCLIVANSFNKVLESNTKRVIANCANFLLEICPHLSELAIINNFKYFDIFNDIAIHVFRANTLRFIDPDFWLNRPEPKYSDSDLEYITGPKENDST